MYRFLALFAVGCGLSPTMEEPSPGNNGVAYVVDKDILVSQWRHPLDLVFVVDTTPEMAPLHDELVAQFAKLGDFIEAQAVTMDLQITVIDADPTNLATTSPLHMLSLPVGGYDRNYTGSLVDELTALVPTTFTATASQPLAALVAAQTAVRRDGAQLLAVIVTNHDDGSPGAVADYSAQITGATWPLDPMIGLVDTPESPRLEQFFDAQTEPYDHANIADSDWSNVLLTFPIKTLLGEPCVGATLSEPYDCLFSSVLGNNEAPLSACDANAANRPCVALVPDAQGCTYGSPVYVKVNWLAWPEFGTRVTGQCVAETPSN